MPQPDFSHLYNTTIPAEREAEFYKWAYDMTQKTGHNPIKDRFDYDVNGLFMSGLGTDERGHATDRFKKPNHPTFSKESMYSGKGGLMGGEWIEKGGKTYYKPSDTNLKMYGSDSLRQYFKENEPDVTLMEQQNPLGSLLGVLAKPIRAVLPKKTSIGQMMEDSNAQIP